jgi:diguanylate cyclase (GGDEF)-like protein
MKILIAEDQCASALLLRRTLERMGHEVTVAGDGEEAWEIIRGGNVPLLISDWMMPKLDGPGLCRRIRDARGDLYTYIILLTSRESREDKLEGLRAGADDFLTKPPDPDELAVRLEIAGRIIDVHEVLAKKNARLAELATIDELTQLKNRRRFNEDLEHHVTLSIRGATPLSLILMDVDRFKQYNDTFGHPAGDEVLRGMSATLRTFVREHDLVARFGGEEFVVLLPSTDAETALAVAERLRAAIASRPWPLGTVTASFGVATADASHPASPASLVEQADQALYRAKRAGRDRVVHAREEVDVASKPRQTMALPASTCSNTA